MNNSHSKEEILICSILTSIALTIIFITNCLVLGIFNIPFNPTNFILIIILSLIFYFIITYLSLPIIDKYF